LSLAVLLSIVVLAGVLLLFGERLGLWSEPGPASPTTASGPAEPPQRRSAQPPAANAIPPDRIEGTGGNMNPAPAGTPEPPRSPPANVLPRAPSGEPPLRDQDTGRMIDPGQR